MCIFFFFKQETAYELRISDWSSDVCSSDLLFVAYAMRFIGENLAIGRGTSIIERLCGRPDICFWNPFVSFTASQNDRQAIKALRYRILVRAAEAAASQSN